jgi:hypothetical protein
MRHFKSISFYFFIVLQLLMMQLHGQQLPFQSFSLAGDYYVPTNVDGIQMDWRLDIGPTAMTLEHSNAYFFSAGFLQPTINRFGNDLIREKYNPSIEIKNTFPGDAIILFSKEPDLILFGFKIFNLQGQVLVSNQTKYRSSYAGRSINMNAMNSGIYIMQVFYLPEYMMFDHNTNYWVKTIKFIKP